MKKLESLSLDKFKKNELPGSVLSKIAGGERTECAISGGAMRPDFLDRGSPAPGGGYYSQDFTPILW